LFLTGVKQKRDGSYKGKNIKPEKNIITLEEFNNLDSVVVNGHLCKIKGNKRFGIIGYKVIVSKKRINNIRKTIWQLVKQ